MRSQERLPFPAEPADASAPIHYVLTARARRIVASESLPDLQLVTLHRRGGDGDADRGDPRPARARALRRSGRDPGQIAAALGVERELVVAWCQPVDAGRPGVARVVGGAVAEGPRHRPGRTWRMRGDDARVAADLAKRPARGGSAPAAEAIRRLDPEGPARSAAHAWLLGQVVGSAPSAASAGFVAGLAHTTAYAVSFQTTRAETAALVVRTIRDHAGLQCGRTRVVLQAGPAVSRDLAAHGWAAALELLPGQVRVVAWPEASGREAVRGIVRISDPRAAATVAGWRDALLAPCRRPSAGQPGRVRSGACVFGLAFEAAEAAAQGATIYPAVVSAEEAWPRATHGPAGAVPVARSDEVRGPGFVPAEVAGRRILLARLPDGGVAAFDAACPHQGQPLTRGDLEAGSVVCPHHRYAYDVTTGANTAPGGNPDIALTVHPAEERDGWIFVQLQPREDAPPGI